jgi:hypothetical protein
MILFGNYQKWGNQSEVEVPKVKINERMRCEQVGNSNIL